MLPLKDVTEAILALRRNGYSSYLLTHRTGSSSPPIHTTLDSPTRLPPPDWGPDSLGPGDLVWIHPLVPLGQPWCGGAEEGGP